MQAQYTRLTRAYTETAPRRAAGWAVLGLLACCSAGLLLCAHKGARMFTTTLHITGRIWEEVKHPSSGVKEILAWSFNGILHCHENRKRRGYTCRYRHRHRYGMIS